MAASEKHFVRCSKSFFTCFLLSNFYFLLFFSPLFFANEIRDRLRVGGAGPAAENDRVEFPPVALPHREPGEVEPLYLRIPDAERNT